MGRRRQPLLPGLGAASGGGPGELEARERAAGRRLLVGVDEVGRGALAGPVVVAAVCLGEAEIPGVADSKAISRARRARLEPLIRQRARAWSLAASPPARIDRDNILAATLAAMGAAIRRVSEALGCRPEMVLVDGNRLPHLPGWLLRAEVKGDRRSLNIAAASILAKEARDRLMRRLAPRHPGYGFEVHVGYGTPAHLEALLRLGPCPLHRRSFRVLGRPIGELVSQEGPCP